MTIKKLTQLRDSLLKDKQEADIKDSKNPGEYLRGYANGVLDVVNDILKMKGCQCRRQKKTLEPQPTGT